ncbi:MAG TPA: PAS domain S-box protein [Cyclobacteriaceae bacterium]|nr:PAS domain S-box protein [Cyclobacteriaceae bacterium]
MKTAVDYQFNLELALEAADVGVWEWNLHTGAIHWSALVEKILGFENRFDGHPQTYLNHVHEADRKKVAETINQAIVKKIDFVVEHRVKMADGSIRWIEGNGRVSYDADGKATTLTGTIRDISDRKTFEEQLRKKDRLFTVLSEITHELIMIDEWEKVVPDTMKKLGDALEVDRVYIFENDLPVEGQELSTSQRFEWNSGDADPQIDNPYLQNLPYSYIEPLYEYLSVNKPFFASTNDVENEKGKELIERQNIQSIIIFPIYVRDKFWGFMGFDECKYERKWTEVEHYVLLSFSSSLSGAIERKIAMQELSESAERFSRLQEASFGGIGMHNKGWIIDCNQGLSNITGYSREELIGMDGLLLISPEWRALVRRHIENNYEMPYDVEGLRKDGTRYFLEIQGKSIPYNGNQIRVTEFRDITTRKLAEEKVIEQNIHLKNITEDLRHKNEQLEEFTQIVSHNLRSPAGNIVTLLRLFSSAKNENERNEYFELLKKTGDSLLESLKELNEVLKIQQNKDISVEEITFKKSLDHARNMLTGKIMEIKASISENFSAAPKVYFPPIYLDSIMLNLLSNAIKYYHPERKPEINFRSYEAHGNIILEVSDNGLGINLKKYGHQVFKLRKTFHDHPEARGIGLFLVKNQIEAMGGKISVSSEENLGCTFIIYFKKV